MANAEINYRPSSRGCGSQRRDYPLLPTMRDVVGLLQLEEIDACAKTRTLAAQKLAFIEQKLTQLGTIREALKKLIRQCDKKLKGGACPIIAILQGNSQSWPAAACT